MRGVAVSVVIPALNEAECIADVLRRIPTDVHEVILVDGNSTDGTVEAAQRVMPGIRIVQQEGRGKGAALRAGFRAARGDIIVHLDADGSTDPGEIPAFVGCLLGGADYAKGTRFMQGAGTTDITRLRRLGNWGFVKLANLLFRTRFSDITYGYNAFWRQHGDRLALEIDGWAHEIVGNIRAARHRLRVVEVASRESPRLAGTAKLQTFSAGWTILNAIVAERFRPVPTLAGQPQTVDGMPVQLNLLDGRAWESRILVPIPVAGGNGHVGAAGSNGHNGHGPDWEAGAVASAGAVANGGAPANGSSAANGSADADISPVVLVPVISFDEHAATSEASQLVRPN